MRTGRTGTLPGRRRLAALACLCLAGCATVYSPGPMGETPAAIDPADWDGLWTEPGIGMVIKTVDAEQGVLDVLMIDGSTKQSVTVHLLRSGGWLFASFNDHDDGEPDVAETAEGGDQPAESSSGPVDQAPSVRDARPWNWVRVVNRDDKLVFWQPHTDRFRKAVERGVLPGRVATDEDGDPVYLGKLAPEHYRLITESTQGVLMDWDEPVVLSRIAR